MTESVSSESFLVNGTSPPIIRYKTRSGCTVNLRIDNEECFDTYGFKIGDRVSTPLGNATVVGYGVSSRHLFTADNDLWFHVDGDSGATYWVGFKKWDFQKRNFTLIDSKKSEKDLLLESQTRELNDKYTVKYPLGNNRILNFSTDPKDCKKFPFLPGQVIKLHPNVGKFAKVIGTREGDLWVDIDDRQRACYFENCVTLEDFRKSGAYPDEKRVLKNQKRNEKRRNAKRRINQK